MRTYTGSYYSVKTAYVYSRDYYNAPLALFRAGFQVAIISAGTSDDVQLFRDGKLVYVYAGNDSLEYMGIEVFEPGSDARGLNEQCCLEGIFLDGEGFQELERLQPINRVKTMAEYYGL